MARLRYNGLTANLGAALASGDTTITFAAALSHSGGTPVPTLTGTDYIPLTILVSSDPDSNMSEVVYLTAYTAGATTGTIARAQESTTATAHASGVVAVNSPTTADFTSAGGGVGTSKDRRWTVPAGSTSIDEFNDDTLDAAWVRVDGAGVPAANQDWIEGGDVLSARHNGGDSAGPLFHGLVRPISAMVAGDAIVTAMTLLSPPNVNAALAGPVLSDGTTFGAGNQVQIDAYTAAGTSSLTLDIKGRTNWSTEGVSTIFGTTGPGVLLYLRIVKLAAANSWRGDYSPDGVSWITGATITKAITPTHVGFVATSNNNAVKHIASYEFLRRVSGVS